MPENVHNDLLMPPPPLLGWPELHKWIYGLPSVSKNADR